MKISVTDAKGQLAELVRLAEAGEEVVLTRHGREAARIVPVRSPVPIEGRRALMDEVRKAGAAKAKTGAEATRSQDFLYRPDRPPE